MSSNLEIVIIHLPDNAGNIETTSTFLDAMQYVKSQKGCRSVRWGRALSDPKVSICFFGERRHFEIIRVAPTPAHTTSVFAR